MAKYDVTHSCGHVQTHELFGKNSERERKISWLEGQDCTECWKKAKREQEKTTPVAAEIINNAFNGGVFLAVTRGDTYSIKDALKAAGCCWREYSDNDDLFGCNKPKKAWMIKIDPNNMEQAKIIVEKLMNAGVKELLNTTNFLTNLIAAEVK